MQNVLFVSLLINRRLVVIQFWRSQKLHTDFQLCVGGRLANHPALLEGQRYSQGYGAEIVIKIGSPAGRLPSTRHLVWQLFPLILAMTLQSQTLPFLLSYS